MFDDGWALVRASNTGPNITMRFEATTEKRLEEIKRFVGDFKTKYPINVIPGRYDISEFFDIAKGLEDLKEGGITFWIYFLIMVLDVILFAIGLVNCIDYYIKF